MKKTAMLCLALGLSFASFAQKKWQTKNGEISFFSSTPVEDIEAKNKQAQSVLNSATGELAFVVLIKGFIFENSLMQQHFNDEYMQSGTYPKAEFKGKIANLAAVNFAKPGNYTVKIEGNLTLHGVTKPITTEAVLTVAANKIVAKSKIKIAIKDYNIAGSEIGKSIAKDIEIKINCTYL